MKSAGLIFTTACAVGLLAMAASNALSQAPGQDANSSPEPGSAVYQPTKESGPVQVALDQFDYALATHDVALLQAAGVNEAGAKRWQEFFKQNPRAKVTDRCPVSNLFVSDASAIWTCTETATIISEGKPRAFEHVIRYTFARNQNTWSIVDRR